MFGGIFMTYTRMIALFCALVCAFGLCAGAAAVEVDSGSSYCFGIGDFCVSILIILTILLICMFYIEYKLNLLHYYKQMCEFVCFSIKSM